MRNKPQITVNKRRPVDESVQDIINLNPEVITLSPEAFDKVTAMIDAPPNPETVGKLKKLMQAKSPWTE